MRLVFEKRKLNENLNQRLLNDSKFAHMAEEAIAYDNINKILDNIRRTFILVDNDFIRYLVNKHINEGLSLSDIEDTIEYLGSEFDKD